MRIAFFTDVYTPYVSGVVSALQKQAGALARVGHEVRIFCPRYKKEKGGRPKPDLEVVRLPVTIPFLGYPGLSSVLPTGLGSLSQVKEFEPDLIHAYTEGGTGWEGLLCARVTETPFVTSFHTLPADHLENVKMDGKVARKIIWGYFLSFHNKAALVISPSERTKDRLEEKGLESEVRVVSNGIELDRFRQRKLDLERLQDKYGLGKRNVLFVGRLGASKKIEVLMGAFKKASPEEGTRLLIVGGGPDSERLRSLQEKLGLKEEVNFTGEIPHRELVSSGLLQAADLFATASEAENQPLSVMEAMASGLPVLGVERRGMKELVVQGENGFLAPPGGEKEMGRAMKRILTDSTLREKMGETSLSLIGEHSLEKTRKDLEKIYQSVLSLNSPR